MKYCLLCSSDGAAARKVYINLQNVCLEVHQRLKMLFYVLFVIYNKSNAVKFVL